MEQESAVIGVSGSVCSIRYNDDTAIARIIDQTLLPHQLSELDLVRLEDYCRAISDMQVRGAPLIGITAAFGFATALREDAADIAIQTAYDTLLATRPTAVNLLWALDRVRAKVVELSLEERAAAAVAEAKQMWLEDVEVCSKIGDYGLELLQDLAKPLDRPLNIMTHCNAGALATIQWGTALAPIYKAHAMGMPVHVWVSETRPRNQGAKLTAWELQQAGVPHTVVADNACGYLMQEGQVDCVIVGSDRTAINGDVCNKIGTYLKALAAQAASIPFFVALPISTVDWECPSGLDIPIEVRGAGELLRIEGVNDAMEYVSVQIAGGKSDVLNPGFDVTPAGLVSALITECGVVPANGLTQIRPS